MSLRIGLVYDDSLDTPGGIPRYLECLAEELTRRGHTVSLLVGGSTAKRLGSSPVHSLARNLTVRFNGNQLSVPLVPRWGAIDEVVRQETFDVLHVQVPYSPLLAGRLIRRAASRTAVVGTFHVSSELPLPRFGARALAAATPKSLSRFDDMCSVSRTAAAFARRTYGLELSTIPNLVDIGWLQSESPDVSPAAFAAGPTIVFLGALVPRKGPDRLLEAFALLVQQVPEATLRVAGAGPLHRSLVSRARTLGLENSVEFLGAVAETEKRALLASADIACFPSRFGESFGIVLVEAIAAGAQVVLGGDNDGYRETFQATPSAIVPTEVDALAGRLLEFVLNPESRRELGARQRALIAQYGRVEVTDQIEAMYLSALARRMSQVSIGGGRRLEMSLPAGQHRTPRVGALEQAVPGLSRLSSRKLLATAQVLSAARLCDPTETALEAKRSIGFTYRYYGGLVGLAVAGRRRALLRSVRADDLSAVHAGLDEGRGLIAASFHLGDFEVGAAWLSAQTGREITAVVQTVANRGQQGFYDFVRRKCGVRIRRVQDTRLDDLEADLAEGRIVSLSSTVAHMARPPL